MLLPSDFSNNEKQNSAWTPLHNKDPKKNPHKKTAIYLKFSKAHMEIQF